MKQFKSETKYTTKSCLKLDIQTQNYPIKIQGRDAEETEFIVELNVKDGYEEEVNLETLFKADFNEEENTVKITVDDDKRIKRVKIEMLVPKETSVNLNSENAPLKVKDLSGKQHLKTENGPIEITEISGEVICETENGPVHITDSQGKIDVNAENGPIALKNCKAEIHLNAENSPIKLKSCGISLNSKTGNGPVRINEAQFDTADIQSDNGMIYYEFTTCEKGDFNFQNDNGKIHVIVPDEIQYKIHAENDRGKFHIGLGEEFEGIKGVNTGSRKTVDISRGAGKVKINIKNDNGSINIVKDPMKRTKHFNFEIPDVSKIVEDAMSRFPDDIDLSKVNEGLEKARQAMVNINIPDVNAIVQNALSGLKTEIEESKEKRSEVTEKVQEKVNKAMEKIKIKIDNIGLSENQQKEVDERSRLKILQMLQDGKITADEAERLMKAMEK